MKHKKGAHNPTFHPSSVSASSDDGFKEAKGEPHKKVARVVSLHETPPHMQGNIYVWTGYRLDYSWKETLWSLFQLHNETWNIWTHLIGYFIFLGLTIHALMTWLADGSWTDWIFFLAWGIAAQFQNFASTFFHWFACVDLPTWKLGCRLDYMAISVLIVGSMWPVFHYIFYCHPYWKFVYTGTMTTFGIGSIFFAWHPYFQTPNFQSLRALTFMGMALIPLLAGPHVMMHISLEELFPAGWRLLMMGGCYIFGAFIYASHVPECNAPGQYDCTVSSHVIWHCFTIAAALWHYSALQTFHTELLHFRGSC